MKPDESVMQVKEAVYRQLTEYGYRLIPTIHNQVNVYYKVLPEVTVVIPIIYDNTDNELSYPEYRGLQIQIQDYFFKENHDRVNMLTVIVTDEPQKAKVLLQDNMAWIFDTRDMRLLIYENQPMEFYDLKPLLLELIDDKFSESVNKFKKGIIRENFSPVNFGIILVNIITFLYLEAIGSTQDVRFMLDHGALYAPFVKELGQYYRLFTCTFLHYGIEHLLSNMVVLFFIGDNVERGIGKIKYLLLYLLSAMAGSTGSYLYSYFTDANIVSAGSSGAIFGVIGALLYMVIINKGKIEDMTTMRIVLLIIYSLYEGITGVGIDNFAHIGGLIAGFFLCMLLYRKEKPN